MKRSSLESFSDRLQADWLPTYCTDPAQMYEPAGFKAHSVALAEADARDCMRAIDEHVVQHLHGGRYVARRSAATEVLFWEGLNKLAPRPITLWLEPVISFVAVARLHLIHGCPKDQLGMQSKGWGFDVVGLSKAPSDRPSLLGEIKKSSKEFQRLNVELLALADNQPAATVSLNSWKKWAEIKAVQPLVIWLLGPAEEQYVYEVAYEGGNVRLRLAAPSALRYPD